MNEPLFLVFLECMYLFRFSKDHWKHENPGRNSFLAWRSFRSTSGGLRISLDTSLSLTPYIQCIKNSCGFYLKIYFKSDHAISLSPLPCHLVRANIHSHLDFLFLLLPPFPTMFIYLPISYPQPWLLASFLLLEHTYHWKKNIFKKIYTPLVHHRTRQTFIDLQNHMRNGQAHFASGAISGFQNTLRAISLNMESNKHEISTMVFYKF